MWILLKLAVSIAAFVIRLIGRHWFSYWKAADEVIVGGVAVRIAHSKSKQSITSTTFLIELPTRWVFKLSRESWIDGVFKTLGVASEIQTGDQLFDDHIYIASDNFLFARELCLDAKLRDTILHLFKDCDWIYGDGTHMAIRFAGDQGPRDDLLKAFVSVYHEIVAIHSSSRMRYPDPYLYKALLVECVIWSIAAYSILEAFAFFVAREDFHLEPRAVFYAGIVLGLIGLAALMTFVVMFMRGSSRGHRIVVESALVLGLSVPFGGTGLVSDINRGLDRREPLRFERQIEGLRQVKRRGRRGRTHYTYHMALNAGEAINGIELPREIQIDAGVYQQAQHRRSVVVQVGRGRLGYPYYRSFDFH